MDSDPRSHQLHERQFIDHVEQLLRDNRLRVETSTGKQAITTLIRDVSMRDRGVDLKRLMSQMGRPDRDLEAQMPIGRSIDIGLSRKKWWVWKSAVARLQVVCTSPVRGLIAAQDAPALTESDVARLLSETPPPLARVPSTLILMSTSGFTAGAWALAQHTAGRTLILASPTAAGGWKIAGPADAKAITDLLDPEGEIDKRNRVRKEIESSRVDLLSSGISTDKLAAKTGASAQLVEAELKSYAKQNPGLTAKKLDGRVVLFREGAAPVMGAASGGEQMPFIDRVRALFSRKGEVEKKIAFLAERRTALSQQRDQGYEDMGALETKEGEMRQQFKDATGDITRRRITSQLLQLRKDIERRQQLLSVLNQQINVVSTHLHNLELQQQGKSASLPDSEEMATDAAAAEEVMAELEANNELADSVGSAGHAGMSAEEQALYEELLGDSKQPDAGQTESAQTDTNRPAKQTATPTPARTTAATNQPASMDKPPVIPQRQRSEPEAG